jgi:hypothetical protein
LPSCICNVTSVTPRIQRKSKTWERSVEARCSLCWGPPTSAQQPQQQRKGHNEALKMLQVQQACRHSRTSPTTFNQLIRWMHLWLHSTASKGRHWCTTCTFTLRSCNRLLAHLCQCTRVKCSADDLMLFCCSLTAQVQQRGHLC